MAAKVNNREDLFDLARTNGNCYWVLSEGADDIAEYMGTNNMDASINDLITCLDKISSGYYDITFYRNKREDRKIPANATAKSYSFKFYSISKNPQPLSGTATAEPATNAEIKKLQDELMQYKLKEKETETEKRLEGMVDKRIKALGYVQPEEKEELTPAERFFDRIAGWIEKDAELMGSLRNRVIEFAGGKPLPVRTLADNVGANADNQQAVNPDLKKQIEEQLTKAQNAVLQMIDTDLEIGNHLEKLAKLQKEKPAIYTMAVAQLTSL